MFIGKNILFLHSGLQQKLFMQQSIVAIRQFITENRTKNKTGYNFFVLTTTDLAKILLDDDVAILQNKITKQGVLSVVKKYKIDTIISFIGDGTNDKILSHKSILHRKGLNIFYKDFYLSKRGVRYFANIAKQSGFSLEKGKTLRDKSCYRDFAVVAIKDEYNNQHILDFFSTAQIGDGKLFFAPAFLNEITDDKKDEITITLQKFGEQLSIKNVLYTISFSIDENGKIIYNNLRYGFSEEAIFSLQRLQINLATITKKILERKLIFFPLNKNIITYSYNYKETLKMNFATRFEDCVLPYFLENKKIVSNKRLVDYLINNNKNNITDDIYFSSKKISTYKNNFYFDFQSSLPDFCSEKIAHKKVNDRYVFMILDDEDAKNSNNIAVFVNICNRIREYIDKEIVLLCEYFPPILSLLHFRHIVVVKKINENVVSSIIDFFGIKNAYVNIKNNTSEVVRAVNRCGAEIYGFDKSDVIFYDKSDKQCDVFADKIGFKFKKFLENNDNIFDVFCINDKYGNDFFKIICSRHLFNGDGAGYFTYPPVFENFGIQEKISLCINNVLTNIKTSGTLHVVLSYKDGELSIIDISRTIFFCYFVLNSFIKHNNVIDITVKSLLGKRMDAYIRENRNILLIPYRNDMFYRTMIFTTLDNGSISISGHSNKRIKDCYTKLISLIK